MTNKSAQLRPLHTSQVTWVVVTDLSGAKIFRKNKDVLEMEKEVKRHKLQAGACSVETKNKLPMDPEDAAFMREVADYLDKAEEGGRFDRLIVAAPPKALGFLRQYMTENVKDRLKEELHKDLMKLSPKEILQHLKEV